MVAIDIVRRKFLFGRIELEANDAFQFTLEGLCRPALTEEEEFEPRSLAMFA